jgi:aryl-alcohol dehydrogenase-like predicted oxidoreductase
LNYRALGASGLTISRVIVGSTMFGEMMDDEDVCAEVHRAMDLGISTFENAKHLWRRRG